MKGYLHPPVQKLAGLLVVELGDHLVEEVYEVSAGPGAGGAKLADAGLEVFELGLIDSSLKRVINAELFINDQAILQVFSHQE